MENKKFISEAVQVAKIIRKTLKENNIPASVRSDSCSSVDVTLHNFYTDNEMNMKNP